MQNYVGRTRPDYSEEVVYPCPKPEDLPALMDGWISSYGSMAGGVDPVVIAASASFGFVYLHPFEDGNGRLHRFIVHHALAQRAYTPDGVIFPVSSAMYRRRKEYEMVLETFSRLVTPYVQYELDDQNRMTVLNDTLNLYRYPDLTRHAEFLYSCIAETLVNDWPRQLRFLKIFDAAFRAVQNIVDMPDAKVRLIVKLLLQNNGGLADRKRDAFSFLRDEEIHSIESAVQEAMEIP